MSVYHSITSGCQSGCGEYSKAIMRGKKKKKIDILATASGRLIDAPLLALDRNHAITRTHCFLCRSINHSTHKTKNVTQKAGREEQHRGEVL